MRSSADRAHWPLSWEGDAPLLARCLDHLGTRPRATRLERQADTEHVAHGWIRFDGSPCPAPQRGATGAILGVR